MNTTITNLGLNYDNEIIRKYSGRGPRYTSYPTAPEWTEAVDEHVYRRHIENNQQSGHPLSLYIHIPFCEERCFFCACNVIITTRDDIAENYVNLVCSEIDLVASMISPQRQVNQFHLGGGTPTHLSPDALARLLDHVYSRFSFEENAERSIEVDLRVTNRDHLRVLRERHFNRISMGVQDFDPTTQEAIRRIQGIEQTRDFISECRTVGFESVNIDLVYGLPYQTTASFKRTLEQVYEIDPDRIALYNYAYLPQKLGHQRRIEESALPSAEERFSIFKSAIEGFTGHGYVYIGMDHFAKPNDELTLAQQEGTLQRNFMGFTTRAGSDMYAFGTSSISNLQTIYAQNIKKLKSYSDAILSGHLPIERGLELSRDDQIRKWVIMELMCNLRIPVKTFNTQWNENFHDYFAEEMPRLEAFVNDGLLTPDMSEEIRVTELGQIIIRPIAMVFDAYLTRAMKTGQKQHTFSRTL